MTSKIARFCVHDNVFDISNLNKLFDWGAMRSKTGINGDIFVRYRATISLGYLEKITSPNLARSTVYTQQVRILPN